MPQASLCPRVRPGLEVLRTGPRSFMLRLPGGEQFELGAEERYLLHLLERPRPAADVLRDYEQRFGRAMPRRHLDEFLEQLRTLKLLAEEPVAPPKPVEQVSKLPKAAAGQRPAPQPAPAPPPRRTPPQPAPPSPTPARPAAATPPAPLSTKDPRALLNFCFDLLVLLFGWVLHPVCIVPVVVLVLVGGTVLVRNFSACFGDLIRPFRVYPPLPMFLVALAHGMLFANLPRELLIGITCRRFGGRIRWFGLHLWGGLVPMFKCEFEETYAFMDERGRWTLLSMDIWLSLALASLGAILWAMSKPGSHLSEFAILFLPRPLITLLLHALVVFKFSGYFMICEVLKEPRLFERALAETRAWLAWRRSPEALTGGERYWFRVFGLAHYGVRFLLEGAVFIGGACYLVYQYQGVGALIIGGLALWWYQDLLGSWIMAIPGMQWLVRAGGKWWVRWPLRLALAGGLVGVGFLPYSYDVGGECRIIPTAQHGARAGLADEITAVHVKEGDYVEAGTTLATLSGRKVNSDIAQAEAELKSAQAKLDMLDYGYRDEDVRIAQNKVESAKAKLDAAVRQYDRTLQLYNQRAASQEQLETKEKAVETAKEQYESAQENLAKKKEGYREENRRAQQAEVEKIQERLKYLRQQQAQLEITTPIAGRVVTPYLETRVGQQAQVGDLLAVVQDTSKPIVEVAADDAAAMDVKEGMPVNVRLYSTWGRLLTGKVVRVAVASEQEYKYGNTPVRTDKETISEAGLNSRARGSSYLTRVYVELNEVPPNLQPEMTGYARIVVDENEVVWRAFARPVVRFVRTEVWSWLP